MRPNRRTILIAAAIELAATVGMRGLTIDAVAAATGFSKAGVLYHFGGRDELIAAMLEHLAEEWDHEVTRIAGGGPDGAPLDVRVAAFADVPSQRVPSSGELRVLVDALRHEDALARWRALRRRWVEDGHEHITIDQQIALLAADGLWLAEATGILGLSPDERQQLRGRIQELATAPRQNNEPQNYGTR